MQAVRKWWLHALLVLVTVASVSFALYRQYDAKRRHEPASQAAPAATPKQAPPAATLYCEFNNFADQTPLVGFYFLIEETKTPPVFAQIFVRERDGSQENFGSPEAPRPEWSLDPSESESALKAPHDETRINLYGYDPHDKAGRWFEAGLRSNRYKNLGGKCRRGSG